MKPQASRTNRLHLGMVLLGAAVIAGLPGEAPAMYNSAVGRWMQRDPVGYADGMSRYQYVRSSPADSLDPTGATIYVGRGTYPHDTELFGDQQMEFAPAVALGLERLCPCLKVNLDPVPGGNSYRVRLSASPCVRTCRDCMLTYGAGCKLVLTLYRQERSVSITFGGVNRINRPRSLTWNPGLWGGPDRPGLPEITEPFIALGHELGHVYSPSDDDSLWELAAVRIENQLRREYGNTEFRHVYRDGKGAVVYRWNLEDATAPLITMTATKALDWCGYIDN